MFDSGFSADLQRAMDTVGFLFHNSAGEVLPFVVFEIIKMESFSSAFKSSETSTTPKRGITSRESIRMRQNNRVSLTSIRGVRAFDINAGSTSRRFFSVRGNMGLREAGMKIKRGSVAHLLEEDDSSDDDDEGESPISLRIPNNANKSLRYGGQTAADAFKSERIFPTRKDGLTIYAVKNITESKFYFGYTFSNQN